jgi:peptide/nickel transport system substrate-binding protein
MSTRPLARVLAVLLLVGGSVGTVAAAPEGEMTWAVHVSLAPTWFDPAETASVITPFMVLYALHDALSSRCRATRWPRAWPSPGACRRTG